MGKQRAYAPTEAPGVIEDGACGQVGRGTWETLWSGRWTTRSVGNSVPRRQRLQELKTWWRLDKGVGETHSSVEAG